MAGEGIVDSSDGIEVSKILDTGKGIDVNDLPEVLVSEQTGFRVETEPDVSVEPEETAVEPEETAVEPEEAEETAQEPEENEVSEEDELLGLAKPEKEEGGEEPTINLGQTVKLASGESATISDLVKIADSFQPLIERMQSYDEYFQTELKAMHDDLPPMPEDSNTPEGEKQLLERFKKKEELEQRRASIEEHLKKNAALFEQERRKAHLEGSKRSEARLIERLPSLGVAENMEKFYKEVQMYAESLNLPMDWVVEHQQYPEVMEMISDAVLYSKYRKARTKVKSKVPEKDTSHMAAPQGAPGSSESGDLAGLIALLDGTVR